MYRKYNTLITETFEHNEKLELTIATEEPATIGGRLKFYRLKAHLTQEELAKVSAISLCTIKRFENNKRTPDISTCHKLATTLGINVELLYDDYLKFIAADYSKIIKSYRKSLNLTQQQLADILNISKKTLSCCERKVQYPSKQIYEHIRQLID